MLLYKSGFGELRKRSVFMEMDTPEKKYQQKNKKVYESQSKQKTYFFTVNLILKLRSLLERNSEFKKISEVGN